MTSYQDSNVTASAKPPGVNRREHPLYVFWLLQSVAGTAIGILLAGYGLDGEAGLDMLSVLLAIASFVAAGNIRFRSELEALLTAANLDYLDIPKAAALTYLQLYVIGLALGPRAVTVCGLLFPLTALAFFPVLWLLPRVSQEPTDPARLSRRHPTSDR